MLMAVQLLDSANQQELLPEGSVSLIILLTDGDPTMGESTASNSRVHNPGGVDSCAVGPPAGVGSVSETPLALRLQKDL